MPHPTGPVAAAFADRIRRLEAAALSERAVRSYETRGREHADEVMRCVRDAGYVPDVIGA